MKALSAVIFFALVGLLVAGIRAVDVAEANFISMPIEPITDPPALIIHSPIDNYSCTETTVSLNITVVKPESWGPDEEDPGIYHDVGISYIHYILDGTSHLLFQAQLINPIGQDLLPDISNFSKSLQDLESGAHSLMVIIYALSQWCPDNSGPYGSSIPPFYFHNMTVTSETIHFTVGPHETLSPSPTTNPTAMLPTPTQHQITSPPSTQQPTTSPSKNETSFYPKYPTTQSETTLAPHQTHTNAPTGVTENVDHLTPQPTQNQFQSNPSINQSTAQSSASNPLAIDIKTENPLFILGFVSLSVFIGILLVAYLKKTKGKSS